VIWLQGESGILRQRIGDWRVLFQIFLAQRSVCSAWCTAVRPIAGQKYPNLSIALSSSHARKSKIGL
jgi:hypothetical protein